MVKVEDIRIQQLQDSAVEPQTNAVEKQIIYNTDQNHGSYVNSIQFDLSLWSNNQKFIDWSSAYVQIPFVIKCQAGANFDAIADNAGVNPYCIGLKNSYAGSLIDSLTVSVNGKSIVQQQSYTGFHTIFKQLSTFSQDDLKKLGSTIGFYPDNTGGIKFPRGGGPPIAPVASFNGDGFVNNSPAGNNFRVFFRKNHTSNDAFEKRMEITTAYDPKSQLTDFIENIDQSTGMNRWYRPDTGSQDKMYWVMLATIRLCDLSDWFKQAGLLRNISLRMTLWFNSAVTEIATGTEANPGEPGPFSLTSVNQKTGQVNPIMVASAETGCPNATPTSMGKPNQTYTISTHIGSVDGKQPDFTTCRFYADCYDLNPRITKMIIENYPVKTIRYNELETYKIDNKTGSFTQIITNGVVNPQYIVVIPQIDANNNRLYVDANLKIPEYQSPFSSNPGTTLALADLSRFQVVLGGSNLFQTDLRYSWENFINEMSVLGGVDPHGKLMGLIDKHAWEFGMRYYVADLSRRKDIEKNIPVSVQVSGQNTSGKSCNYIILLVYQKEHKISMTDGQNVE